MYDTEQALLQAVQAIPGFVKVAKTEPLDKQLGTIERVRFTIAYEPVTNSGTLDYYSNVYSKETDQNAPDFGKIKLLKPLPATFRTQVSTFDTVKDALETYLKANFNGYFIDFDKLNPDERFAVATVYKKDQGANTDQTNEMRVFVYSDKGVIKHQEVI